MTVIEVIDLARDILNEPLNVSRASGGFPDDTSSFFTDTQLLRYFNQVQRELNLTVIQAFENYLVTEADLNISNNVDTYGLPANFIKLVRAEDVRNSPATEIYPISLNEKEQYPGRLIYDLVNQGNPDKYFLKGTSIVFRPVPNFTTNSAVKLWYAKRLADMVATTGTAGATATSEIPQEYHEALAWGIVKLAWISQQTDPTPAEREFLRLKEDMKKALEDRQIQQSRYVKDVKY